MEAARWAENVRSFWSGVCRWSARCDLSIGTVFTGFTLTGFTWTDFTLSGFTGILLFGISGGPSIMLVTLRRPLDGEGAGSGAFVGSGKLLFFRKASGGGDESTMSNRSRRKMPGNGPEMRSHCSISSRSVFTWILAARGSSPSWLRKITAGGQNRRMTRFRWRSPPSR
jgi:hypothetical protein